MSVVRAHNVALSGSRPTWFGQLRARTTSACRAFNFGALAKRNSATEPPVRGRGPASFPDPFLVVLTIAGHGWLDVPSAAFDRDEPVFQGWIDVLAAPYWLTRAGEVVFFVAAIQAIEQIVRRPPGFRQHLSVEDTTRP